MTTIQNAVSNLPTYTELQSIANHLREAEGETDRPRWKECILDVLKDGTKMTSKELYDVIESTLPHPWDPKSKTPENSCSKILLDLYKENKVTRGEDKPFKYYFV